WQFIRRQTGSLFKSSFRTPTALGTYEKTASVLSRSGIIKRFGKEIIFFSRWLIILAAAAALAYINHFDPGACRHLAIGLVIAYFIFVFIDIGFAIVFLNFILFNEAFLCINYAIAGLSAGSRRNAVLFGICGFVYLSAFILNLLYAPFIFQWILNLPQSIYLAGYIVFSIAVASNLVRLFTKFSIGKKRMIGVFATL